VANWRNILWLAARSTYMCHIYGKRKVLIIPLGGWLLSEINCQFKVVSDSGF
jgi:hypothetical protein